MVPGLICLCFSVLSSWYSNDNMLGFGCGLFACVYRWKDLTIAIAFSICKP